MRWIILALAALSSLAAPALAQSQSPTFDAVMQRGRLVCGTATELPGFGAVDKTGAWQGLYVDDCRAVAAALFGDATKVQFVATTTANRLPMLQTGEIDILASNTTWTLPREAALGLAFVGVTFYDGQGFLVKKALGVSSAKQLDGATVCVQPGTTTELNLADWSRANKIAVKPVVIDDVQAIHGAFISGRCDVFTLGTAALAAFRASQGAAADDYVLLPEIISKEPLGPVIRKGDWKFFDLVRWTHIARLQAEEFGITAATVKDRLADPNPDVKRFLGVTGEFGKMLGVANDWTVQVIAQTGNFSESWERHVTPLGLKRGMNALWTAGGIQYPPPMR
ncbi:MAG: amino acid ABC transporter substrate-binding protein [Alphaproteobacteria bacterium]|nr:amino acid ABC transporter substrate-binding protein [Alphaproteobacteria bacterium]